MIAADAMPGDSIVSDAGEVLTVVARGSRYPDFGVCDLLVRDCHGQRLVVEVPFDREVVR